jgi:hypothetical protein
MDTGVAASNATTSIPIADIIIFYEYIVKSIMRLFPDAAPMAGRWVVIKCDGGPGRLNDELLTYLQFH